MEEIRNLLDRVNEAWRARRYDELQEYFADDIVMKGPGLKELVRGKGPVVQSYADFMDKSDVTHYTESNHFVHRWDQTAAAGFDWSMTWVQNGTTDSASGQDMFVFERRGDRWIAVLRVMLF
jgi:ketosteroid isomerase-like protein